MTHDIYLDSIVVYDPNIVTWYELTQMGLREQVASSWIAWRKAGKVFHCTQDIEAVRGISSLGIGDGHYPIFSGLLPMTLC